MEDNLASLREAMQRRRAWWKDFLTPIRELLGLPENEYDAQGRAKAQEERDE